MALTVIQRGDIQNDLGISADQSVFTNDELDRLFERAASDYNGAVYLGIRVLLMDAAKFTNYTEGNSRVEKARVFDNLLAMLKIWQDASTTAVSQVAVVGLTSVPPRWKEYPATDYPCTPRYPRRVER